MTKSHLLRKSLMENFIFCAVTKVCSQRILHQNPPLILINKSTRMRIGLKCFSCHSAIHLKMLLTHFTLFHFHYSLRGEGVIFRMGRSIFYPFSYFEMQDSKSSKKIVRNALIFNIYIFRFKTDAGL